MRIHRKRGGRRRRERETRHASGVRTRQGPEGRANRGPGHDGRRRRHHEAAPQRRSGRSDPRLQRALHGRGCRVFEQDARFADVAQPPPGVAIEAAREQSPHGRRCGRVERGPVDVLTQDGRDGVGHIVALKGPATRQHFVEHGAKGPDVAPLIGLPPPSLLGTHIRGSAENHAALHHGRARDRGGRRHIVTGDRLGLPALSRVRSPTPSRCHPVAA